MLMRFEETDRLFLSLVRSIRGANEYENLLVDVWFDSQIWRRRHLLGDGLIALCGPWPNKSLFIAENFFAVRRIDRLRTLDFVPEAYFVIMNWIEQKRVLRDFLVPYLHHFAEARTPPHFYAFTVLDRETATQGGGELFRTSVAAGGAIDVAGAPMIGRLATIADAALSQPPAAVLEGRTSALAALRLAPAQLW